MSALGRTAKRGGRFPRTAVTPSLGRASHVLRESHAARVTDPPAGPAINRDRAPATAGQSRRVPQLLLFYKNVTP